MGELARYRRDRDLHLSRGHLAAGVSGVVLLTCMSFFLGFRVGHQDTVVRTSTHFTSEAPREDLVELLARVEASGDTTGGVDAMTFPDALTQNSGGGLLQADSAPSGRFQVEVGRYVDVADARSVREHLRTAGVQAWVGAELEAGVMTWRVAVGGFASDAQANEGMTSLSEALATWTGPALEPHVIQR